MEKRNQISKVIIVTIIALIACTILFINEAKSQIAPGYQVATWHQFKTAAVSYTLDDDCPNQLLTAVPMFDKYNFKVTLFTVITWSPNWSGLLSASNNGHEIGSHTNTHPTLNTISVANQNTELGQSQATINSKIPNAQCVTVAYPNCVEGDLPTIQKYYIAGRTCNNQVELQTPNDFYDIGSIITGTQGPVQVAADFNSKVAAAKASKGWCVFLTHAIDTDPGYSPTKSVELQSHLAYMNTNIGDFWVATFGNVFKYIQERNAASLTETKITSDSLQLVVADNLNNSIYNVPITISRVMPTGWTTPKLYIGGKITAYTLSTVNGTTSIVFDVIPNQGNVYLANTTSAVATNPPTVITPITYCQGVSATALSATGTNLLWYTAATGGTGSTTAPIPSTTSVGTTNYYVTQTVGGIESSRTVIAVTVNAIPTAPAVTTPVTYCQNATAVALTATGTGLLWYTAATGGTGSGTAPTPSTTATGTTNYYVSQTTSGCESPRGTIAVTVNTIAAAPAVTTPVTYCQGATAIALTATGTALKWYTAATGGTSSTTAPIPVITATGTTNYYVSQTTSGCESPRAVIAVTVNAIAVAPAVTTPVTYCQNATATALTATGTGLLWYTAATGGTSSTTAPTPSTTNTGTTNYYVSQTTNSCESPRATIAVTVNAIPAAPAVATPVSYCQGATAIALTATGTALKWYTAATGGNGSTTAPTPSTTTTGTTNYYVSQTTNSCESPRTTIAVTVNTIAAAPAVTTPVTYCQNATAIALTATGTALKWYTVATGGTSSTIAPTPSTSNTGTMNYYVSQTSNGCEGPRATIALTVNAIPNAPTVTTPVTYCQGATAIALTANGTALKWYTAATGGTSNTIAPTPVTTATGTTNYYVSQTTTGCESPRATIAVTVNAIPNAPTVTTPVTYCQGATATALTASGTGLLWYTAATGGTGSTTAPTPNTANTGTTNYYVSQTTNGCESPRATIAITVNTSLTAPVVTTPVTYCQNATATVLTANGTGLLWYTVSTGGTGSTTAPVPNTSVTGTTNYYVSQTSGTCESARAVIAVTVNALPAPIVTSSSTMPMCTGSQTVLSTGTASTYSWDNGTNQVGTGQTYTATAAGSYTVTVSNGSGCAGTSSALVVSISSTNCYDCANVLNGTASIDNCGVCTGGTTGLTACTTTGTIGSISGTSIVVYPQPFENTTKVELKNGGTIESITIYSSTGSLVYIQTGINRTELEVGESLADGLYNVIIQTQEGTYSARIVKIK